MVVTTSENRPEGEEKQITALARLRYNLGRGQPQLEVDSIFDLMVWPKCLVVPHVLNK